MINIVLDFCCELVISLCIPVFNVMDENRKRSYRTKVKCEKCNKIIYYENRIQHLKRKHAGDKDIEFSNIIDPKQRKLSMKS